MKLNLMQWKELEIMKETCREKWDYLMYLIGISDGNIWRNIDWELFRIGERHISKDSRSIKNFIQIKI